LSEELSKREFSREKKASKKGQKSVCLFSSKY
jgi:hypothetical protein